MGSSRVSFVSHMALRSNVAAMRAARMESSRRPEFVTHILP
jgi:hypothetical protein